MAPEKTEAIVLTGRRRPKDLKFRLGNLEVVPKKEVSYLGVIIDKYLTFGPHINNVCKKAERTSMAVIRLMPNIGGPTQRKRSVLGSVLESTILYAAPVWKDAVSVGVHRERLLRSQRKIALRIARAYKTVSTEAVLVIAGLIPMDLKVEERVNFRDLCKTGWDDRAAQTEARETATTTWQQRWARNSGRAEWTKALIRNIKPWITRGHGKVNYQITQFLTGHGNFQSYLKRFKISTDDRCLYCGREDTAEHTVLWCDIWVQERTRTETAVGAALNVDNLVALAIESRTKWEEIMGMVTKILTGKEKDMRESSRAAHITRQPFVL